MICIRMTEVNCSGQFKTSPRGGFCRNVDSSLWRTWVTDHRYLPPNGDIYAYSPTGGVGKRSAIRMPVGS